MYVREFEEGRLVAQALLVLSAERRTGTGGQEQLKLVLGDRTGRVEAVLTDGSGGDLCRPGAVVWVAGRFSAHGRFGPRLTVESVRSARPDEYVEAELTDGSGPADGPLRSAGQLESDLRELMATVRHPDLQRLLGLVLGHDSPSWAAFREAPAAKRYHQAYRHGLLEHSLTVAQAVSAASAAFSGIDRDVAVTGALLHDIGKLEAYELRSDAIEMSDQGRLYGEIPLGYYRVRRAIEQLDGFPTETAQAVLHIILSHHGSLEHGSPVVPCTREATLVHMVDNLGARLGSFDRLERGLAAGEQWSVYDKGIGGGAYFAWPAERERRAA